MLHEDLVLNLEELRRELVYLCDDLQDSGVERTAHFLKYIGEDCEYYKKSLDLLVKEDWDKLRNRVRKVEELMELVDGR